MYPSHMFLCLFSLSDNQVGYDKQGLPIGFQVIGRPWCEATVLRLGAAIEVFKHFTHVNKNPLYF